MFSKLDWDLIEAWCDADVPVELVLRGIDAAFEKFGPAKMDGLRGCAESVLDAVALAVVQHDIPDKAKEETGRSRMKDCIGNELAKGKRVMVQLPQANVFGYVSMIEESSLVSLRERKQGRIIVNCVLALPADDVMNMVSQCVVVEDPEAARIAHEMASAAVTADGKQAN
jgi:hypothetical protein